MGDPCCIFFGAKAIVGIIVDFFINMLVATFGFLYLLFYLFVQRIARCSTSSSGPKITDTGPASPEARSPTKRPNTPETSDSRSPTRRSSTTRRGPVVAAAPEQKVGLLVRWAQRLPQPRRLGALTFIHMGMIGSLVVSLIALTTTYGIEFGSGFGLIAQTFSALGAISVTPAAQLPYDSLFAAGIPVPYVSELLFDIGGGYFLWLIISIIVVLVCVFAVGSTLMFYLHLMIIVLANWCVTGD